MATQYPRTVFLIVWAAFTVSIGIYVAVGLLAAPKDVEPPSQVLAALLGVIAIGLVGAGFFARTLAWPNGTADYESPSAQRAFGLTVVAYALFESCGIFGLVLALLGAPPLWTIPFYVISFAAFAVSPPAPAR
ncbi:MAG: hypothetical protein AAF533_23725 [Acidobacteriota bacterium]